MDIELKSNLKKIADTIRSLSIEAIEKAKSGHPGLPLGCAELAAYLYGVALNHYPKNSTWLNRDRFVLSAGHGSMLLYSALHLSGFNLSIEEIKRFRQLHAKTPGHPEAYVTEGVEATTGPLGHGIGNAVGMAIGQKILKEKFNNEKYNLFNSKIYCLAGDGCMMEGAASEASSLAAHLCLDNLILIYDSNKITLDGPLCESTSEDTKARYRAYGWDVFEIDGHDLDAIDAVFSEVKQRQERPTLIVANTIIGKGSPHKAGTHKVHGSPLGEDEVKATKQALNLPEDKFYVAQSVYDYFNRKLEKEKKIEENWNEMFSTWANENPSLFEEFKKMQNKTLPVDLEDDLKKIEMKNPIASRETSGICINYLADVLPFLYSGSADLSSSDKSFINKFKQISHDNFKGRNIKYGVREFAMGTISNGLALFDFFIPIAATFLVFSDYMRNAIRLASLTKLQVIYQFTHDSIFLGEDGPTHQAVEQIASLRAMPNLHVIRPCDSNEVKMAWLASLNYKGPSALILSRQSLANLDVTNISYEKGLSKGAYIIKKENKKADFTIFASGSEVSLALEVAKSLTKMDKDVRVVSVPSFELFDKQPKEYKDSILKGDLGKKVSVEAACDCGREKFIGLDGISISVDSFGISAPIEDLKEVFGFTVDAILQRLI
ncbi:MAG: Transketolase [Candidatus Anoxychlamydiales bacterium]|nr:Transketolase [Candidatus Anoxychlamydiales bacterium]